MVKLLQLVNRSIAKRIGERILVRTMQQYAVDYRPFESWSVGSECNGAFAQYHGCF